MKQIKGLEIQTGEQEKGHGRDQEQADDHPGIVNRMPLLPVK